MKTKPIKRKKKSVSEKKNSKKTSSPDLHEPVKIGRTSGIVFNHDRGEEKLSIVLKRKNLYRILDALRLAQYFRRLQSHNSGREPEDLMRDYYTKRTLLGANKEAVTKEADRLISFIQHTAGHMEAEERKAWETDPAYQQFMRAVRGANGDC